MAGFFDPETIERLRTLPPRQAYNEVKDAVYRLGPVSSDDFREVFEELVDLGVLRTDQIEEFEI